MANPAREPRSADAPLRSAARLKELTEALTRVQERVGTLS